MRGRPGFLSLDLEDEDSGLRLRATAWRALADMPPGMKGRRVRIAYSPRIDRYNGASTVELRIKDWKEAEDR
jgi:single-stranded-DNA-specific exonuclease